MAQRSLSWGLDEIEELERVRLTAVLQCSGNGRGFYRPSVPGIPWERGAVGQAVWSGVRLADVLGRAGIKAGAATVHLLGADPPRRPGPLPSSGASPWRVRSTAPR